MAADLEAKTDRYGEMLDSALSAVAVAVPEGSPLYEAARECVEMAESYLTDGRHFREADDPVNALAAFSYGYGWLDCGVRVGLFHVDHDAVPDDEELFTT